jgi:hypothetical protein
MSVYVGQSGLHQVASAQRALDVHVVGVTGRCLGCGAEAPCAVNEAAAQAIGRYGQLPRRRPGASRPDLVDTRLLRLNGARLRRGNGPA